MPQSMIRIGTRGSDLALAQSRQVADALRRIHPNLRVELAVVRTTADARGSVPVSQLGGKGVFTIEIEEALIEKRVDLAVHSLKDLPVDQRKGLTLGPIPQRASAYDMMIARAPIDWRTKPLRVGTASPRRKAQLLSINPLLEVVELRGNVPFRLSRLVREEFDALVLAEAGLNRLGLLPPWTERLEDLIPAPCQGALGLQYRADDNTMASLLGPLGHSATEACCIAERELLRLLGGDCMLPLGAHAQGDANGNLRLQAWIELDGKVRTAEAVSPFADPCTAARIAAEALQSPSPDQ